MLNIFFLKRVIILELVVHTIAYKEQEPSVSQISLVTEGWRNVGDAEST